MTIPLVIGVNPLQTTLLKLGIVSGRVALLLRSAEIHPVFEDLLMALAILPILPCPELLQAIRGGRAGWKAPKGRWCTLCTILKAQRANELISGAGAGNSQARVHSPLTVLLLGSEYRSAVSPLSTLTTLLHY